MRIQIYDEEVTGEIQVITKTADTGLTFTGIRIFLASPEVLHNIPGDDDRSAITFWFEKDTDQEDWVRSTLKHASQIR